MSSPAYLFNICLFSSCTCWPFRGKQFCKTLPAPRTHHNPFQICARSRDFSYDIMYGGGTERILGFWISVQSSTLIVMKTFQQTEDTTDRAWSKINKYISIRLNMQINKENCICDVADCFFNWKTASAAVTADLMAPVCVTPSGSTGPSGSPPGGNRPHLTGKGLWSSSPPWEALSGNIPSLVHSSPAPFAKGTLEWRKRIRD